MDMFVLAVLLLKHTKLGISEWLVCGSVPLIHLLTCMDTVRSYVVCKEPCR